MPGRKFKATATTAAAAAAAITAAQIADAEVLQNGTDTHSLTFPDKTWAVIDKLASANTDGNRSRLLAMLAHQADMVPDAFGLKSASSVSDDGKTAEAAQA